MIQIKLHCMNQTKITLFWSDLNGDTLLGSLKILKHASPRD